MPLTYLTRKMLTTFNERVIEAHGGRFVPPENLLNDRLDYVVDMVQDDDRYEGIVKKAAFYFVKIAQGHMFNDGNKRTALAAMQVFLNLNGYQFKEKVQPVILGDSRFIPSSLENSSTDGILEALANETAQSEFGFDVEGVAAFVSENIEEMPQ